MWKLRGGMGGGGRVPSDGMLRSVRRMARQGVKSIPETTNGSSSSASSPSKRGQGHALSTSAPTQPLSSYHPDNDYGLWPFSPSCDEFEWVHGVGDNEPLDGFMNGPPSLHETEDALFSLNQFVGSVSQSYFSEDTTTPASGAHSPDPGVNGGAIIQRIRSVSSDSDWDEPVLQIYEQSIIPRPKFNRVYDALHMLESEPRVQKMVISLSTDKAVWDAIMSNEAVREFRESYQLEEITSFRSDENSDDPPASASVLAWMFDNARVKFMELITNVTDLMNSLFQPATTDPTEGPEKYPDNNFVEKVRTAFMLTSIVLMIVIMTRAHRG